MSTTYSVIIDLKTVGSLDYGKGASGSKSPEKTMSLMKGGWQDVKSAAGDVAGVLDGVVGSMMGIAKWGALAGGTLGAGAMVYGVKDLNNELESTKIALGTIFSANGIANSLPEGMSKASDVIKEMRQDAKALPGEMSDLKNIFTTGAIDAFRGGLNENSWEKLSAKVMAASKVAQVQTDMAAREFAQLMEGRAGAHNVLGTRLFGLSGASAKQFNSKTEEQRIQVLSTTLDKYSGSIGKFGESFDGLSSSLIDNGKELLRQATEPLFNAIKGELTSVNAWFDGNQGALSNWAGVIGYKLVDAFAWGKQEILLWWPAVSSFAENAYTKLKSIWEDMAPSVQRFGAYVRDALKDPGTIDKLIHLLELWIAVKGAGMVVDSVQAGVNAAKGGYSLYKGASNLLGLGAGAAGVGGAATLNGGAAVLSLDSALAGLAATIGTVTTAALTATAIAVPTAIAGGLAYGAWGGVKSQSEWDDQDTARGKAMADKAWDDAITQGKATSEVMKQSQDEIKYMNANFQSVTAAAYDLQIAARYAAAQMLALGGEKPTSLDDQQRQGFVDAAHVWNLRHSGDANKKKDKPVGGGHGGTNIQKVEITVTSNESPSRIARLVYDEMGKAARNPQASRYLPNYSTLKQE